MLTSMLKRRPEGRWLMGGGEEGVNEQLLNGKLLTAGPCCVPVNADAVLESFCEWREKANSVPLSSVTEGCASNLRDRLFFSRAQLLAVTHEVTTLASFRPPSLSFPIPETLSPLPPSQTGPIVLKLIGNNQGKEYIETIGKHGSDSPTFARKTIRFNRGLPFLLCPH